MDGEDITGGGHSYCFMLMDTQREAEIGLGKDWPFEPL
jgi:hypothetical protein